MLATQPQPPEPENRLLPWAVVSFYTIQACNPFLGGAFYRRKKPGISIQTPAP